MLWSGFGRCRFVCWFRHALYLAETYGSAPTRGPECRADKRLMTHFSVLLVHGKKRPPNTEVGTCAGVRYLVLDDAAFTVRCRD